MALSASIVFEVRFGGSDTNGGGFKTGASGTDWSLQNSAQYSVTDGVTVGSNTITSASANFGTDVIGNLVYVQGGTGSIVGNWYEITARASATSITVDRSTGLTSGTGVTLHIGGALATPGQAMAIAAVSGQVIWWQYSASTFTMTTATAGAAGPILFASATNLTLQGYDVTRGDHTGNRPKISWGSVASPGVNSYICSLVGSGNQIVDNISIDCNSVANVSGITLASSKHVSCNNVVINASGTGCIGLNTTGSSQSSFVKCQANACATGYSLNTFAIALECEATACTTGFNAWSNLIRCLARGCTTGFTTTAVGGRAYRCTSDGNTNGFAGVANSIVYDSCIASNNTGVGFTVSSTMNMNNCAVYNNGTHVSGTPYSNISQITLSVDPYVAQGSADFRPNNNNPGGAQLRGASIGVYGQTDNSDVGAVQHTDPTALINQGEY